MRALPRRQPSWRAWQRMTATSRSRSSTTAMAGASTDSGCGSSETERWRRSSYRTPSCASGEEPASSIPGTVRGLKGYEHLLLGPDLGEAMSSLSQKHREVLELYYHRDLTQQEIADRLNVPWVR